MDWRAVVGFLLIAAVAALFVSALLTAGEELEADAARETAQSAELQE